MGRLFNLDNPVMAALSRVADLLILNIITFICCIPIFTIGAALTAMHSVLLKMARKTDSYIVRSYFSSFKQNFKQATGMWLIFLAIYAFIGFDFMLILNTEITFPRFIIYLLIVVLAFLIIITIYAFALEARFVNTVRTTLGNAVILSIAAFPRSLAMLGITLVPVVLWYFAESLGPLLPLVMMFGISAPAYVCALLYSPVFLKLEPKVEEEIKSDMEWSVDENGGNPFARDEIEENDGKAADAAAEAAEPSPENQD